MANSAAAAHSGAAMRHQTAWSNVARMSAIRVRRRERAVKLLVGSGCQARLRSHTWSGSAPSTPTPPTFAHAGVLTSLSFELTLCGHQHALQQALRPVGLGRIDAEALHDDVCDLLDQLVAWDVDAIVTV